MMGGLAMCAGQHRGVGRAEGDSLGPSTHTLDGGGSGACRLTRTVGWRRLDRSEVVCRRVGRGAVVALVRRPVEWRECDAESEGSRSSE
jgi:hypothetical protein